MDRPRIVVTLIVKNEAHVIERCLTSLRPVMDAICIVDTGSSDETPEVIRKLMREWGVPGCVYHVPWRDFAYNRTRAIELSRLWGDYTLMIDADEQAFFEPDFDAEAWRRSLTADCYHVMLRNGAHYVRPQITSTKKNFCYRGKLHEFLMPPEGTVFGGTTSAFYVVSSPDGARSRNPNKYADDAALLEEALRKNEEPGLRDRYVYYCAQSYRDSNQFDKAIERYEERAAMGGWDEEVFSSLLWSARLRHLRGDPPGAVIDMLLRATDAVPRRAEALTTAAEVARHAGRWSTAFSLAGRATMLSPYDHALFLEPDVYDWRARFECSIAAFYVGEVQLGHDLTVNLLQENKLPPAERAAAEGNLSFYRSALGIKAEAAPPATS